jgi:hypothetical protein
VSIDPIAPQAASRHIYPKLVQRMTSADLHRLFRPSYVARRDPWNRNWTGFTSACTSSSSARRSTCRSPSKSILKIPTPLSQCSAAYATAVYREDQCGQVWDGEGGGRHRPRRSGLWRGVEELLWQAFTRVLEAVLKRRRIVYRTPFLQTQTALEKSVQ